MWLEPANRTPGLATRGFFASDLLGARIVGDLFDDLYAPRATRYGDDIDAEHTADALPDRHGYRYHLSTGCRCPVCATGCTKVQAQSDDGRQRAKVRPWEHSSDIEPALTYDEWKAARSA